MSIFDFEDLRRKILQLQEEDDFPLWLLPDISKIAEAPERFSDKGNLVRQLLAQMENYDPYAGAGCFSESSSIEDIQRTLRSLLES